MSTNFDAAWDSLYNDPDRPALWSEEPIPLLPETIRFLHAEAVASVLDVGTGDGRNLIHLAQEGFVCAGLDVSVAALQRAYRNLHDSGRTAILIPGDCHNLPVAPETIESITAFDVFGQLARPEQFIESARQSLRPGGVLVTNAFTPEDSEYGQGEEIGRHQFNFKGTLFRFFEAEEMQAFFGAGWRLVKLEQVSWEDPPHGEFRPYKHTHVNHFVIAVREGF